MEQIQRKTTLPGEVADTYFCEDQSDFHKLVLGHVESLCQNNEDAAFLTMGTRIICHEYLALVLSGQMKPYEMNEKWVKLNQDGFRDMIHTINERLVARGVPMKEGEGGKVEIDYDKIKEDVEKGLDKLGDI